MSMVSSEATAIAGIPASWWLRLAHDLRGPVAPMRMAVQMLQGGLVAGAEREESLRLVDRQLDVLLGGIEDIGDLLRLHAGSFVFRAEVADLGIVLQRVAGKATLERWLRERQLRLVVEPAPAALPAWHDATRLASLLDFLVRKAARHAAPGDVLVLGLRTLGDRAHWSLHGSGPGLSKDPEVRVLAGESAPVEDCEARCLVMREVARRHGLAFDPLRDGSVGFSQARPA